MTKPFQSASESLQVTKQLSLCFEFCDTNHIPSSRNEIKNVLKALKSFSNIQLLSNKRLHELSRAGKSDYIKLLFERHEQKLFSIDSEGSKRIIFYYDPENKKIVKILSLFFDDHSKR